MNCDLNSLTYIQDCKPFLHWWIINFPIVFAGTIIFFTILAVSLWVYSSKHTNMGLRSMDEFIVKMIKKMNKKYKLEKERDIE